jgi:hypothetical protein
MGSGYGIEDEVLISPWGLWAACCTCCRQQSCSIELLQSDKLFLFQEHVEGALVRMGMIAFVQDFALPLINEVGAQWQAGLLPIFLEHVFSSHLSSLVAKHTKSLDQKLLQRGQSKEARPVLPLCPPTNTTGWR